MLADSRVIAMVAVSDSNKAREFYGGTLELKQIDENPGGIAYMCGDGILFAYVTPNAGTNKGTSATWEVENIEEVVKWLQGKGITFERYEMPGATIENDVHVMGPMKAAWFKDPDGNILGLSSM